MATEFGFNLGPPATAGEVAVVLADTGLAAADEVRFEPPGTRLRSGVLVVVGESKRLPFPHPVEERYGFAPAVGVLFRFDSSADPLVRSRT